MQIGDRVQLLSVPSTRRDTGTVRSVDYNSCMVGVVWDFSPMNGIIQHDAKDLLVVQKAQTLPPPALINVPPPPSALLAHIAQHQALYITGITADDPAPECPKCKGRGKIQVLLLTSVVEDPCPSCSSPQ